MRKTIAISGLVVLAGVALAAPWASTRQGVNFEVTMYRMPPYLKAMDFINRDLHYQALARRMTQGKRTDEERALAVLAWTREHVRMNPPGLPTVDDHVWNIIIRGYGLEDQMADVFTTLCTYAGVPAWWRLMRAANGHDWVVLSFARLDGKWALVDVGSGFILRDEQGAIADLGALYADPARMKQVAEIRTRDGSTYRRYLEGIQPFEAPKPLRAEKQMLWPRLWFELRKVVARS